jgi:hypothetical protein
VASRSWYAGRVSCDDLVLLAVEQGSVALPDKPGVSGIDLGPFLRGTGIDGTRAAQSVDLLQAAVHIGLVLAGLVQENFLV